MKKFLKRFMLFVIVAVILSAMGNRAMADEISCDSAISVCSDSSETEVPTPEDTSDPVVEETPPTLAIIPESPKGNVFWDCNEWTIDFEYSWDEQSSKVWFVNPNGEVIDLDEGIPKAISGVWKFYAESVGVDGFEPVFDGWVALKGDDIPTLIVKDIPVQVPDNTERSCDDEEIGEPEEADVQNPVVELPVEPVAKDISLGLRAVQGAWVGASMS